MAIIKMIPILISALSHICIEKDFTNDREERTCFFGTYSRFQELASRVAESFECPTDCSRNCLPQAYSDELCNAVGILAQYREPCGSYYADKLMPYVFDTCGTFGGFNVDEPVPSCPEMATMIFDPRIPACHIGDAPTPETASFGVFYSLLTVGLYIISKSEGKSKGPFKPKQESNTQQPRETIAGNYHKNPGFFL